MRRTTLKKSLLTALSLLSAASFSIPACLAEKLLGQISVAPSAVHVAGEEAFTIQAPAGNFSALERTLIVERNISNALVSSVDKTPNAVTVEEINNIPVIRIGGFHVVTIDSSSAKYAGMSMRALADQWAGDIKKAMADQSRVNKYAAQLSGDFLGNSMTTPYRRARCEAARLNHAAPTFKEFLTPGTETSDSVATKGMHDLLVSRDPVAAEQTFRKSITQGFENSRAHYGLGVSLMQQGRIDPAITELQLARWQEPDYAMVHLALGQAYETQGKAVAAEKQYREASRLQPDNPEPYLLIADIREDRNDMGKSVLELGQAMVQVPDSQYILLRRKDQNTWRLHRPY
jgi:tetratricopeptide (TPR) repeat protein